MVNALWVGLGGGIGSVLRYLLTIGSQQWLGTRFPIGTLIVNLVGCLLIGAISQVAESREEFSESLRIFLVVGILGGFTTFSSFGNDTINAMRASGPTLAGTNVAIQVIGGIFLVWCGRFLIQSIIK